MEEQNNTPQEEGRLTNAQLELQADSQGPTEVKRITYSRLIARRFFRQRSAVIGLIILIIMILIAIFGPFICAFDYTEPDFTALNVAPNARHWFGTDGGGFDLFACVVHGLGRSLVIGITYSRSVPPSPTCVAGARRSACGSSTCSSSFLPSSLSQ